MIADVKLSERTRSLLQAIELLKSVQGEFYEMTGTRSGIVTGAKNDITEELKMLGYSPEKIDVE